MKKLLKKKAFRYALGIFAILYLIATIIIGIDYFRYKSYGSFVDSSSCNVLAFSVNGYLATYIPEDQEEYEQIEFYSSEKITQGIETAKNDPNIKAVILVVDSAGGDPVAGEEIANALKWLEKPSISVIRGLGASSAYWASTGADKIYASKMSEIGSIGVTMSYLDESKKIEKEGYEYTELSSAKYKNLGDPARSITKEEKEIILSDLNKMHDFFVENVSRNRGLAIEDVQKIANGLTYIGQDALEFGLIDEIGDYFSAKKYIEEEIIKKEAKICWY